MESNETMAIEAGKYGFGKNGTWENGCGFNGIIMWGGTEAEVVDASFELCVRGGVKIVDFYDGTWKGGVWGDGLWRYGTWLGGLWRTGFWENGIWHGGEWRSGLWTRGTWLGGIDNRNNPDKSMDCFVFHVKNGRFMCNDEMN